MGLALGCLDGLGCLAGLACAAAGDAAQANAAWALGCLAGLACAAAGDAAWANAAWALGCFAGLAWVAAGDLCCKAGDPAWANSASVPTSGPTSAGSISMVLALLVFWRTELRVAPRKGTRGVSCQWRALFQREAARLALHHRVANEGVGRV